MKILLQNHKSIWSVLMLCLLIAFGVQLTSAQEFDIPENTVEVYDDENSTQPLTGQTDFDDLDNRQLTIRWNYTGTDVNRWDVYVRRNDGGFFFLHSYNSGDVSSYTWNNPDVNIQYEFRVWGTKMGNNRIVLNQEGPMGYNLTGGSEIKLKKIANPDDIAAQSAIVVDDLFHSTDLSFSSDDDTYLESALALKFNPGEGEFFDSHIQISTDGENYSFLGQTGAADIFYYRFDRNETFIVSNEFDEGPQTGLEYWFRIYSFKTNGERVIMDTGPVSFTIDQNTLPPTPTPMPPTPTPTPTPLPQISISGNVSYLIDGDTVSEGDGVANAEVSVIPALYSVSNVTFEPARASATTNSEGEFEIVMPATIEKVRLRVLGDNHYTHVGPAFDATSNTVQNETVIPLSFKMQAYDAIFRHGVSFEDNFNGESVPIQLKLSNDVPWLLLNSDAIDSGNTPTQQEIDILMDIITNKMPAATRNLLESPNPTWFDSPAAPPNYSEMGLPESYILGWWWDNPEANLFGTAYSPTTDPNAPEYIVTNDFSINTMEKISEKLFGGTQEEVLAQFTTTALQMVASMAGGHELFNPDEDMGGLSESESVFVIDSTAQEYTQFDKDALYITYIRDKFTIPDLNIAME